MYLLTEFCWTHRKVSSAELTGKWVLLNLRPWTHRKVRSRLVSLQSCSAQFQNPVRSVTCDIRSVTCDHRAICKRKPFRFEQYPFRVHVVHVGFSETVRHQCEKDVGKNSNFFYRWIAGDFSLGNMFCDCKMCYTCFSLAKSFSISYRPWYRSDMSTFVRLCPICRG